MSGRLNRAAAQQPNKVDVDKDDDDANKIWSGYSWESNKLRSWDQIEEDPETGRLKSYVIAFDENHFRESLSAHVVPPPTTSRQVSPSLIRMGFPMLRRQAHPTPYCNNPTTRGRMGYNCPRCNAWLSDVPCECVLCGLTLVSSPHLARSYHHLFPVPRYSALDSFKAPPELAEDDAEAVQDKIETLRNAEHVRCVGCTVLLKKDNALRVVCPKCLCPFCIDCDAFVHESLHQCPGCDVHQHRQAIVSS